VVGSPVTFTATATPGAASAEKSSFLVAPKTIVASTGSNVSVVTLVVRDAGGNPIPGQTVTLTATGAGVSLTQPAATDASGSTTGQFSATVAGDHDISAVTGGVSLGAKTVTVTSGPVAPSLATADVPSGAAGVETVVTVRLQDGFGNPVSGAAAQVSMVVAGANSGAKPRIEDAGGGAYRASYTPTRTGTDQLDVRVAAQSIPGSPFPSVVIAGPADPEHTTADVPNEGQFGVSLTIVVHVADALGNPLGRGGDLVVVIPPAPASPITAQDLGDGSYRASWTPFTLDKVKVGVTLNGTGIHGSPFEVRIRFVR
jgi:adhesin/invasin